MAGGTTGALYKFSMGPKGMVSGGLVGMAFGGIAGLASLAILRASGTTMEEVRFWQYKWKASRDEAINESLKVQSSEESDQLLDGHHRKFGAANITLDNIAAGQSKVDSSVSQKDVPVTEKTEKK